MPERIQLKRTAGWRMPADTVKVDRTTRWGNHFRVIACEDGSFEVRVRDQHFDEPEARALTLPEAMGAAVRVYADWLHGPFGTIRRTQAKADLRGLNLACWCKPDAPCHADVLLEVANEGTGKAGA